jgi:hypothetical protein
MQAIVYCIASAILLVTGASFAHAAGPNVIASGNGERTPKQPQAAIGHDGSIHIVFGVGNTVQYTNSTDGGSTFAKSANTFEVPNMSLGMRRGPRIAATKDAIVVTAVGGKLGRGKDGDVLAWRSMNAGKTWLGPVRVNDKADSAREGLHAMAAGEDGSLWCVWLDLRFRKSEIYAARSIDGGETWEPNIRVYQSPDGSVCQCCHPSVIVQGTKLVIMFRNLLSGNRDMYVMSSTDNGKTFTTAEKLGHGTWPLDACPMDGGMLAALIDDTIETAWRRDDKVYLATNTAAPEVLLGRGQQPWIAGTNNGSVVVWTTGREGDLMIRKPGTDQPQKLASNARDPIVVTSSNSAAAAICCWESKINDNVQIVVQQIDVE